VLLLLLPFCRGPRPPAARVRAWRASFFFFVFETRKGWLAGWLGSGKRDSLSHPRTHRAPVRGLCVGDKVEIVLPASVFLHAVGLKGAGLCVCT
jgi:hypothetical protein